MVSRIRNSILLAAAAIVLVTAAQAATQPLSLYRLGAVGYAGESVERSTRLLAGYLASGLRAEVRVQLFARYDDILAALEKKELELAILPPVVFLVAEEKAGVKPLANPVYQSGDTNYRSVILTLPGRADLTQLLDLKMKKVAFVDPHSASGYIIPHGMLHQAGLAGKRDVREVFTGNHVKSIEALIAGEVDAAATYDMLLVQTPALGKSLEDFSVLARSDPIPSEVLVGARDLPEGQAVWIRSLLSAFGKLRESDHKYESCVYQWFYPHDPTRYEQLRKLWKAGR